MSARKDEARRDERGGAAEVPERRERERERRALRGSPEREREPRETRERAARTRECDVARHAPYIEHTHTHRHAQRARDRSE